MGSPGGPVSTPRVAPMRLHRAGSFIRATGDAARALLHYFPTEAEEE